MLSQLLNNGSSPQLQRFVGECTFFGNLTFNNVELVAKTV